MESKNKRIIEVNRCQNVFRAIDVESLINEDHHARAVWDFVSRLDLSGFYEQIEVYEGQSGRPAWDPKLLVSLWIFSYSQGISSAREIERRCLFDPAFQWLAGMEVINHHTLSSFRMGQKEKLDELFTQILALLSMDGLITLERVAHDGTKIKALASSNTFRSEERLKEYLKLAEDHLKAIADRAVDADSERRKQKAKERAARERKEKLELALKELEDIRGFKRDAQSKAQARASLSDPEARIMKQGNGGYSPSYNAQISTDAANGIVISARLTKSYSDDKELTPSIDEIEKTFSRYPKQVIVDAGYSELTNIISLEEKNIDFYVPMTDKKNAVEGSLKYNGIKPEFSAENFKYDATSNTFTCPRGHCLAYNGVERGKVLKLQYQARKKDCQSCSFKKSCCPKAKKGRTVIRTIEPAAVTAMRQKMETEEAKEIYKTRAGVAEFSNAWLKSKIKLRQFCVRGRVKAEQELKWACMALNIQYWSRLAWV